MKKILSVAVIIIAGAIVVVSCNNASVKVETGEISQDSLVKRGHYLVAAAGCGDCHSPKIMGPNGPEEDPNRLLSGHPSEVPNGPVDTAALRSWFLFNPMITSYVGPWGTSYSANLTSDSTGIGSWTEQQFFKAIREGRSKGLDGNRMLMPPMPWFNVAKFSDTDLKAIFAYLKSTKPVKNVVPAPLPPGAPAKKS